VNNTGVIRKGEEGEGERRRTHWHVRTLTWKNYFPNSHQRIAILRYDRNPFRLDEVVGYRLN
jgi:hypothetical protein